MIKYLNSEVTFREIPEEICLCINITNCPHRCHNCHSPELREDMGEELTFDKLKELIDANKGISCVCLMGGDNDVEGIQKICKWIQDKTILKSAWYSGGENLPDDYSMFDYVKIGPYIEEMGPLDNPNTNQILYHIINQAKKDPCGKHPELHGYYTAMPITHKFWNSVWKDERKYGNSKNAIIDKKLKNYDYSKKKYEAEIT